ESGRGSTIGGASPWPCHGTGAPRWSSRGPVGEEDRRDRQAAAHGIAPKRSGGLRRAVVGWRAARLADQLALEESPERLPGTMETRLHRVRRDPEEGGYLVGVQLLDVAQEEDAAVVRRQAVDGVADHRARLLALEQHVARRVPARRRLGPVPVLVEARE